MIDRYINNTFDGETTKKSSIIFDLNIVAFGVDSDDAISTKKSPRSLFVESDASHHPTDSPFIDMILFQEGNRDIIKIWI